MKSTKLLMASLVLWTSIMIPIPLSSAALPAIPDTPAFSSSPVETLKSLLPDSYGSVTATSLKEAVNRWIRHIGQEPGYEAWRQAAWSSYPLGPGTHGWIILIQSGGKDIGYMVVHAADPKHSDSYHLTEYGNGGKPLFSAQTLYQSLVQLELIDTSYEAERWYIDPMHAVWKIRSGNKHYYLDAKTGEVLPNLSDTYFIDRPNNPDTSNTSNTSDILKTIVASLTPEHIIKESLILPDFDPYDKLPWVKGSPSSYPSFSELRADLQQHYKLVFTAELYDGKVLIPLAVTGYQQWSNDEVFLIVEHDGKRAIPYPVVVSLGKLFR